MRNYGCVDGEIGNLLYVKPKGSYYNKMLEVENLKDGVLFRLRKLFVKVLV